MSDERGARNEERGALNEDSVSAFHMHRSASGSAPAKLILCGEHAVVYGRPAIALPLTGIRAGAEIIEGAPGSGIRFNAPALGRAWNLVEAPDDPLSELAQATLRYLNAATVDLHISLTSAIPIASGMGSGAAIGAALVHALAAYFGQPLGPAEVSALVYASEQRYHGTPSGIDNTVIAYEQPVWFVRRLETRDWGAEIGEAHRDASPPAPIIESIAIAAPFTLLIGDTGVRSATHLPVGEVRRRWQAEPERYEALFDQIGAIVREVRQLLAGGASAALGPLLDQNQALLEQLGVSSPEIARLVTAARSAGAAGAKLSGGGWGGVILALVDDTTRAPVADALREAGATQVLETNVTGNAARGM